jgi:predicted nucleotidyltransferase
MFGKDRDEVLAILRAHEPEFRAAGIVGMSIFGSVARREPHPQDVDIAVRLGEDFSEGGFDYFYQLEQLQRRLRRLLRCEVDVLQEPANKQQLQNEIDRDRAIAF